MISSLSPCESGLGLQRPCNRRQRRACPPAPPRAPPRGAVHRPSLLSRIPCPTPNHGVGHARQLPPLAAIRRVRDIQVDRFDIPLHALLPVQLRSSSSSLSFWDDVVDCLCYVAFVASLAVSKPPHSLALYLLSEWSDFAPRPREVRVGNPTGRFFQAPSREQTGFVTAPSRQSPGLGMDRGPGRPSGRRSPRRSARRWRACAPTAPSGSTPLRPRRCVEPP